MPLLITDIKGITSHISYKDGWVFYIGGTDESPWLQIRFDAPDNDNPNITVPQQCRKWKLSPYMLPSEIVRAAWKAVLAAEEHEAAERFKLHGTDIFNPHVDLFSLVVSMQAGYVGIQGRPEQPKLQTETV
jgi:hypothetical protein